MKFTKVWCFGHENGRVNEDDFIVQYNAENGSIIKVNFLFGNESYRSYTVNGEKHFHTLKDAKAYCEDARAL